MIHINQNDALENEENDVDIKIDGSVEEILCDIALAMCAVVKEAEHMDGGEEIRKMLLHSALSAIYLGSKEPPKKDKILPILEEIKDDTLSFMKMISRIHNEMKDEDMCEFFENKSKEGEE